MKNVLIMLIIILSPNFIFAGEPNSVDPNEVVIRLKNINPNKAVIKVVSIGKDRITIQVINVDCNSIVVKVDEKVKNNEPVRKVAKRVVPEDSDIRASWKYVNEDQVYRHRYEIKEQVHLGHLNLIGDSSEHNSDRIYGYTFRERRVPKTIIDLNITMKNKQRENQRYRRNYFQKKYYIKNQNRDNRIRENRARVEEWRSSH